MGGLSYGFAGMESEAVKEGTGTPFVHPQAGPTTRFLEHFHESRSEELTLADSGLFALSRYFFSVNVLRFLPGFPGEKSRVVLSLFSADAQETRDWREC